jgi:hypothetical protein
MVEPAPAAFVFNYTRTFVLCQERDANLPQIRTGRTYKRLERLYPILATLSRGLDKSSFLVYNSLKTSKRLYQCRHCNSGR